MAHFMDLLTAAVVRVGNPVLVGLDPQRDRLPEPLRPDSNDLDAAARAYLAFCQGVVDVVAGRVAAVKPQAAFFEQLGPAGMWALHQVIRYARDHKLLVILDGKRNDIGSTALGYAEAYLGEHSPWSCDALTVSPYLGSESLDPFLEAAQQQSAGIFVLVKTSNPGGGLFQDLIAAGEPVYRHVARYVQQEAARTAGRSQYGLMGAVVGATYPEQLAELRSLMPNVWLLVPGYGAQGGSAADVAHAFDAQGRGALINSSRAIIFAHQRPEFRQQFGGSRWQDAVSAATDEMIRQLRSETPARHLSTA